VNFHGYPRYTKDIDFWLWMTPANIEKLLAAIKSFGFGGLGLSIEDFMSPENIIQLGYEPYRIDLLMDVDGVEFEPCFERRIDAQLDDVDIHFLSVDDLIKAKKQAGRLQDLADAEQLEKLKSLKQ
jgi:hypothetical protein